MGVWFPLYGFGDGNTDGHAGSCAGTPSKSAAKPLHPNGTLGTHVVPGSQSGSAQSVRPSLSSSEPFRQSSPPGIPPVLDELLLDELAPPAPPLP
jgi:hypothetical protein